MEQEEMEQEKLLVEIAIPFCKGHCRFCWKTVYRKEKAFISQYLRALEKEIRAAAPELAGCEIAAIHIGGGAPLTAGNDEMADFLDFVKKTLSVPETAEWSMDVTPDQLSAAGLTVIRNARISVLHIGVMTGMLKEFRQLGRPYYFAAFDGALSLLEMYRQKGISTELLVGIPGQTEESLRASIDNVWKMHPDYVTLSCWPDAEAQPLLEAGEAILAEKGMVRTGTGYDFSFPGRARKDRLLAEAGCSRMGFGAGAVTSLDGLSYRNTPNIYYYIEHSTELQLLACDICSTGTGAARED